MKRYDFLAAQFLHGKRCTYTPSPDGTKCSRYHRLMECMYTQEETGREAQLYAYMQMTTGKTNFNQKTFSLTLSSPLDLDVSKRVE